MLRRIFVFLILVLVVTACQPQTANPVVESTATQASGVVSTDAPTVKDMAPAVTATFTADERGLKQKWQRLMIGATINYLMCPLIVQTAEQVQNGEIDQQQVQQDVLNQGIMLYNVQSAYDLWPGLEDQLDLRAQVLEETTAILTAVDDWQNGLTDPQQALAVLQPLCDQNVETLEAVRKAAEADGVTKLLYEAMLRDLQLGDDPFMVGALQ
ncbi:MAG: hypothetical protein CVU39_26380 [Chloroflexi bacterium HGW-Chloroflexi-10]|nr:MAG: hypothetical protein CVU39_26380 [Chloroflexi bacterium HGW-Chloroflexi-10]